MKPLTCHLHVGMNKTGSTAIQRTLAPLARVPCRYLSLGRPNHSARFGLLFEDAPWKHLGAGAGPRNRAEVRVRQQEMERRLDRELAAAAADPGVDSVLFSGERMSSPRSNEAAVGRLKQSVSRWCDDFRVHGYVRAPVSFMESALQQRIKMAAVRDQLLPENLWPGYRERFERFDAVFGADRVRLCKFAPEHLVQGDVVLDLAAHVGMTLAPDQVRHDNQSLNVEAVALLFALCRGMGLNGNKGEGRKLAMRLARVMMPLGSRRLRLLPELTDPLLARHGADVAWIEARLGQSLEEPARAGDGAICGVDDLPAIAADARPLLAELEARLIAHPVMDGAGQALTVARMRDLVEKGLRAD